MAHIIAVVFVYEYRGIISVCKVNSFDLGDLCNGYNTLAYYTITLRRTNVFYEFQAMRSNYIFLRYKPQPVRGRPLGSVYAHYSCILLIQCIILNRNITAVR